MLPVHQGDSYHCPTDQYSFGNFFQYANYATHPVIHKGTNKYGKSHNRPIKKLTVYARPEILPKVILLEDTASMGTKKAVSS